jgi:hypothetical protein
MQAASSPGSSRRVEPCHSARRTEQPSRHGRRSKIVLDVPRSRLRPLPEPPGVDIYRLPSDLYHATSPQASVSFTGASFWSGPETPRPAHRRPHKKLASPDGYDRLNPRQRGNYQPDRHAPKPEREGQRRNQRNSGCQLSGDPAYRAPEVRHQLLPFGAELDRRCVREPP